MGKRKKKAEGPPLPTLLYMFRPNDGVDLFFGQENLNEIKGGKKPVGEYVLVGEGQTQTFLMPSKVE